MMERDPENHTRWKHKRRRHNREIVWEKIATDWAGKEEWMSKRKVKNTLSDMYQFVTFAIDRMKQSTVHRKKEQRDWEEGERKDTEGLETRRYHHPHSRRWAYCTILW